MKSIFTCLWVCEDFDLPPQAAVGGRNNFLRQLSQIGSPVKARGAMEDSGLLEF